MTGGSAHFFEFFHTPPPRFRYGDFQSVHTGEGGSFFQKSKTVYLEQRFFCEGWLLFWDFCKVGKRGCWSQDSASKATNQHLYQHGVRKRTAVWNLRLSRSLQRPSPPRMDWLPAVCPVPQELCSLYASPDNCKFGSNFCLAPLFWCHLCALQNLC